MNRMRRAGTWNFVRPFKLGDGGKLAGLPSWRGLAIRHAIACSGEDTRLLCQRNTSTSALFSARALSTTPRLSRAAGSAAQTGAAAPSGQTQPEGAATPSAADPVDKVDLRVGLIESVKKHPEADMLYVLKVDLGEQSRAEPPDLDNRRTIVSGLVKHYQPEQLLHKKIVVLANMKPRKLRGITSQGMLLAASSSAGSGPAVVEVLEAPADARPGDLVFASMGSNGGAPTRAADMPAALKPLIKKQKVVEQFIEGLSLDARIARYKGCGLQTESGGSVATSALLTGTIG